MDISSLRGDLAGPVAYLPRTSKSPVRVAPGDKGSEASGSEGSQLLQGGGRHDRQTGTTEQSRPSEGRRTVTARVRWTSLLAVVTMLTLIPGAPAGASASRSVLK
jgi:hypothetical protein